MIEGVFVSKTVTSVQIKVHETYVKPLKPRKASLSVKESDDEESEEETEIKTLNISDIEEH